MAEPIRIDEWLAELAKALAKNDEGLTVKEIAASTGKSADTVRKMLNEAIATGKAYCSGRKSVARIDGPSSPVPVYKITDKAVLRGKPHK